MAVKPKSFVVPVEIYEQKVVCLITKNPTAVEEAFAKMKLNYRVKDNQRKIAAGRGGLCWYGCNATTVIWMGDIPRSPKQISILVHECAHATVHILDSAGVPVKPKTDEALCYLLDHLVQKFLEQMRKPYGRHNSRSAS